MGSGPRAFFFDFDGVLAPIRNDPESVWPRAGHGARAAASCDRCRPGPVVSARPVAFLADRLSEASHVELFGLYELQTRRSDGGSADDPTALRWVPVILALRDRAIAELPDRHQRRIQRTLARVAFPQPSRVRQCDRGMGCVRCRRGRSTPPARTQGCRACRAAPTRQGNSNRRAD